MHLALLAAAAATFSFPHAPPAGCRADQPVLEVTSMARKDPPVAVAPKKLGEMPPAQLTRAVRRLVHGCDYAEIRTPTGWALKSDQELRTMAGYPKAR